MSREAMQLALEALEEFCEHQTMLRPIEKRDALRQALVDADDISQKRVDEMVKLEHDKQIEIAQAYERGWNAALAQQEPVAYFHNETELLRLARRANSGDFEPSHWRPLYTAPPKRDLTCVCGAVWEDETMVHPPRNPVECMCGICKLGKRDWVGLTDEDIHDAFNFTEMVKQLSWDREPERWCENFAAYIEAKLKDKNHG